MVIDANLGAGKPHGRALTIEPTAPGWIIDGFELDGKGAIMRVGGYQPDSLVNVRAHDTTIRNSWLTRAPSSLDPPTFLQQYVEEMSVYLISDLKTRQFFCPSGVGVEMAGVDPAIGSLQIKSVPLSIERR